MMRRVLLVVLGGLWPALGLLADEPVGVYRGSDTGVTPAFAIAGPWTLDWRVTSEFPELAQVTIRLADGASGDFVAELVQVTGTGDGYRLMPQGGNFRFDVVGVQADWELIVEETDDETAARLLAREKTGAAGREPGALLNEELSDFSGWSAEDERTLILVTRGGGLNVLIRLRADCPGLTSAERVSFVAPMLSDSEAYDSVLLENGTRCYFASVGPTSR